MACVKTQTTPPLLPSNNLLPSVLRVLRRRRRGAVVKSKIERGKNTSKIILLFLSFEVLMRNNILQRHSHGLPKVRPIYNVQICRKLGWFQIQTSHNILQLRKSRIYNLLKHINVYSALVCCLAAADISNAISTIRTQPIKRCVKRTRLSRRSRRSVVHRGRLLFHTEVYTHCTCYQRKVVKPKVTCCSF